MLNSQAVRSLAILGFTGLLFATSIPLSAMFSMDSTEEYGSWIWVSPIAMSDEERHRLIEVAAENGMNALYVTVDDYLSIHALPDGPEKDNREKAYMDAVKRFVEAASEKGIAVEAETGWRDWAEPDKRHLSWIIADFVMRYNAIHEQKIRSIQFDIEPYLLPAYEENKAEVLSDFVQLVDETVSRLGDNAVGLTVVIPHFYDSRQEWTPAITHQGKTAHAFTHILDSLDRRPNSRIIVMSYRNESEGDDGAIALSRAEIEEASDTWRSTKIIVAQETGEVEPEYVTFHGKSKEYYVEQTELIKQAFQAHRAYGGIAVHYLDTFLHLE